MRVIATTVSLLLLFLFAASVLLSKQDTYIASSFNGLSVPVAAVICAAFVRILHIMLARGQLPPSASPPPASLQPG